MSSVESDYEQDNCPIIAHEHKVTVIGFMLSQLSQKQALRRFDDRAQELS